MPHGVPLIVHAAALSPAIAVLAFVLRGGATTVPRWLFLGCLVSLVGDGLGMWLGSQGINNQWLTYLAAPALFGSFLMGLAVMQHSELERRAVRVAALLLCLASGGLALAVEDVNNFSQFALPLGALLVLVVALLTILKTGLWGGLPGGQPAGWLWAPLGLALYAGVTAAYFPLAAAFADSDRALVLQVLELKSLLVVVSFLLVTWWVVCQRRAVPSGPSSLSSSSPSRSS